MQYLLSDIYKLTLNDRLRLIEHILISFPNNIYPTQLIKQTIEQAFESTVIEPNQSNDDLPNSKRNDKQQSNSLI